MKAKRESEIGWVGEGTGQKGKGERVWSPHPSRKKNKKRFFATSGYDETKFNFCTYYISTLSSVYLLVANMLPHCRATNDVKNVI